LGVASLQAWAKSAKAAKFSSCQLLWLVWNHRNHVPIVPQGPTIPTLSVGMKIALPALDAPFNVIAVVTPLVMELRPKRRKTAIRGKACQKKANALLEKRFECDYCCT
jgi:hypothetical protein